MTKLTLNETTLLALKNHLPLELVPGRTDNDSYRFHCLINYGGELELSLVFGDEKHGYLFDSAWARTVHGSRLRIKEEDIRTFLEKPAVAPRWSRDMPDATNSKLLHALVLNSDIALVRMAGEVTGFLSGGGFEVLDHVTDEFFYIYPEDTNLQLEIGETKNFQGTFRLGMELHEAITL